MSAKNVLSLIEIARPDAERFLAVLNAAAEVESTMVASGRDLMSSVGAVPERRAGVRASMLVTDPHLARALLATSFIDKLMRATRRHRKANVIRMTTVSWEEAAAAFWELMNPDNPVAGHAGWWEASSSVIVALIAGLQPPGRPRRSPAENQQLLARRRRRPAQKSSGPIDPIEQSEEKVRARQDRERVGGGAAAEARRRLKELDRMLAAVRATSPEDFSAVESLIGSDGVRTVAARLVDFASKIPPFLPRDRTH